MIGPLGNLVFKLHNIKALNYIQANICCEHQISSGNLSQDSAFNRRTLLFNLIVETKTMLVFQMKKIGVSTGSCILSQKSMLIIPKVYFL